MNEETLFLRGLLPARRRAAAFLDQTCGADAALGGRVEALLHAHDNPGSLIRTGTEHRDIRKDSVVLRRPFPRL